MRNSIKVLLLVLILALVVLGAALLYNVLADGAGAATAPPEPEESPAKTLAPQASADPNQGLSLAPDFTVYDDQGGPVNLSGFLGRTVVLNFWASWCGPCKAEMPDLQDIYDKYGQDVVFMMVSATDGYSETQETASEHIEQNGYTFPVYFDLEQDAATAYGLYGIPTTYIINSDGYIEKGFSGMIDPDAFVSALEEVK